MSFLIFADGASADIRNHAEAAARGAGASAGDVTELWWVRVDHPTDGRASLSIPKYDQAALSSDEQAALVASLPADWIAR